MTADCPIQELPKSTRSRPDAREIETRLADRNDMAAEVSNALMIDTAPVEYASDTTCVVMIIKDKPCRVGSREIFRVDALCSSEER